MIDNNKIRFFRFFAGLLISQINDPLCSKCRALTNSYNSVKEMVEQFTKETEDREIIASIEKIKELLGSINPLPDLPGQKREGNCKMPKGVCFIKSPKKIFDELQS